MSQFILWTMRSINFVIQLSCNHILYARKVVKCPYASSMLIFSNNLGKGLNLSNIFSLVIKITCCFMLIHIFTVICYKETYCTVYHQQKLKSNNWLFHIKYTINRWAHIHITNGMYMLEFSSCSDKSKQYLEQQQQRYISVSPQQQNLY